MGTRGEDQPGLREFCRRMYPQLVGTLTIVCGDRGVAEELTQETLIRVWDRWEQVRLKESPEGWAHHVAMNLARSWFRRKIAERRANQRTGTRQDAAAAEDVAGDLTLLAAVRALPPRQREVIALRYYAGLPVEQVATLMGCAQGTVKSLTSKAIDALRRERAGLGGERRRER